MGTVVLYNIISLIVIFVLVFALKIVNKSDLNKINNLLLKSLRLS